jgi:cell wall-associated NlpC family hydrolase
VSKVIDAADRLFNTVHGMRFDRLSLVAAGLILLALGGCSTAPKQSKADIGASAAKHALDMRGKPYRAGGSTPRGFDCSGLVHYSYGRAGIRMPRATPAQRSATTLVSARSLRPGDLLFFDQEGKKASHVGLYLGDGRFVHAPSTGGRVRTDSLSSEYWKKHFVEARRI